MPWSGLVRLGFVVAAAALLLGWVGFAGYNLVTRWLSPKAGISSHRICGDDFGMYCSVVNSFIAPWLTLGLVFLGFILYRYSRVRRSYQNSAKDHPNDLVPTAGSIVGDVVGREQLCRVLMHDVRERETRRPHILIGSVGAGKTAVLVRLMKLLASYNVVPVAIRLRNATKELDFQAMARERLKSLVDPVLRSNAESDKIWRQLRRDNRVVVLADGLDEALVDNDGAHDRDTVLRQAIDRAVEQDLPLIVASRPHDPLRGTRAIIIELEPLGQGPALEYLTRDDVNGHRGQDTSTDLHRLTWLVRSAEVAGSPLYMQIIHELNHVERLWEMFPQEWLPAGPDRVPTRHPRVSRSVLRWHLLEAWRRALVNGDLYQDYALDRERRRIAVEVLSALACIGLKKDRLEVKFADLVGPDACDAQQPHDARLPGDKPQHRGLHDALMNRLWAKADGTARQSPYDLRIIATMGAELGVVEARQDSVRFRHSIIQAYLGSRHLDDALRDESYTSEAFRFHGKEFLIALAFQAAQAATKGAAPTVPADEVRPSGRERRPAAQDGEMTRDGMIKRAKDEVDRDAVAALNIFATALEIDSIGADRDPAAIISAVESRWDDISRPIRLDRAMDEAKLDLVHRFGDAVRAATDGGDRSDGPTERVRHAYRTFYQLMGREKARSIRLAAALEIGASGAQAFDSLKDELKEFGPNGAVTAASTGPPPDSEEEEEDRRKRVMCAWLAPLLYYWSTADDVASDDQVRSDVGHERETKAYLEEWLEYLAQMDPSRRSTRPSIALEIALARGFKLTANQRHPHSSVHAHRRAVLIEKAEWALTRSRFWFSQLTLIQALTLWSLPDDPDEALADRGHGSNPKKQVDYWVSIAGTRRGGKWPSSEADRPHPFVLAAAALCTLALQTRRPAEFCWIDEHILTSHIGSYSPSRRSQYGQHCWIMDSVGWTTLHPTAQQLLADVMLMLNLIGRGGELSGVDARLTQADRRDLPPCITTDRRALDPDRAIGSAQVSSAGSNCLDHCPFRLCPYPPRGETSYSEELDEGFCNRQIYLLRPFRWLPFRLVGMRHRAHWEGVPRRQLRHFWWHMSQRTRPKASDIPSQPVKRRMKVR
ncbi:hypothetical protein GCM10010399_23970 [Dactylosporangium fulvum]|uniref:ATP-binding protein n=1 Tax=Dactylosporangium fulvum TaxID=53359 RepID=A0ABY5WBT8_9ACTN|nr:ATP-binding protein [Dactylosporangium fulvum]UWP85556.1 ATP-binding protein [Dactylosporangium fulvum]